MSDLEHETTGGETATFEQFGREWTVPTKRHHKHIVETKRIVREEGGLDADDIAKVYLSDDDYAALLALDVDGEQLDAFASKVAEAMGLGSQENS